MTPNKDMEKEPLHADFSALLHQWNTRLEKHVTLVGVSKEQPIEKLKIAYEAGLRHFGENRTQALETRYHQLPKDIHWHMIGHLQRNKLPKISPFVHLIHSVDNEKLLIAMNKEGEKHQRLLSGLLQVKISPEEKKYGLSIKELDTLIHQKILWKNLPYVRIIGLMGMASFHAEKKVIQKEFDALAERFQHYTKHMPTSADGRVLMQVLSMGMSHDYPLALQAHSNMLRIGQSLFGKRE